MVPMIFMIVDTSFKLNLARSPKARMQNDKPALMQGKVQSQGKPKPLLLATFPSDLLPYLI